jgi:predicted transcriptional regulator
MIDRGSGRPSRSARRREPTELYASVLEVVKRHHGVARITRVSYGVGMPVDRLRLLLGHLLDLGLLKSEELDGRPSYDITARGQEFLDTYWKMRGFVEGLDRASAFGSGEASRRVKPGEPRP